MPGGDRFVAALRACWDAGDAVLPLDPRLSRPAARAVLRAMAPACVVDGSGDTTALADAEAVAEGDCLVVATSGTTGEPKGVVLTQGAVEASARATSARLGVDPACDRWLACLPMAHVGGLSVLTRALVTGTPVELQASFSVEGTVAAARAGANLVSLVPTALGRLGPERAALFRRILLGGQQPPGEVPGNCVVTYGMTETGSGIVYDGLPLDGVELRVCDGEIFVRGPMLLRCYRDGSDPKDEDGWLATGDSGDIVDGRLVVHGRLGDLVISGGENIWPSQVEAVLRRHPDVSDVAVAGTPDPEWGSRLVAYVVPSTRTGGSPPGRLLAELRLLVAEQLAPFAAPRELVVVRELPKGTLGKTRRESLARLEGPRAAL